MATDTTDVNLTHVYVRLNFSGYIPPLNAYGPIKASWVEKEKVKELIRSGYDVELINRAACPEFAKQLDAYRKALAAKDYVGAKAAFTSSLDRDPNSATETALRNAEALAGIKSPLEDANAAATQNPVDTGTSSPVNSSLDAAVQQSLAAVGESVESGNVGTGETLVDAAAVSGGSDYSEDMANLVDGAASDPSNGAGVSEFGDAVAPTDSVDAFNPNDDANDSDNGTITVTKKNKKHH